MVARTIAARTSGIDLMSRYKEYLSGLSGVTPRIQKPADKRFDTA
jgi:hypothetical protein